MHKSLKGKVIAALMLCLIIYAIYKGLKHKALSTIPPDGKFRLVVTLENIQMINNHSVGDEWGFAAYVNETAIGRGQQIEFMAELPNIIPLTAVAQEYDSAPDVGWHQVKVPVQNLDLANGSTCRLNVVTQEDRGRYAGNTAEHAFYFSIKRKVSFSDIINAAYVKGE